ncbi:MAG: amidohydrolase family protein [Candidatus Dormibacteraeota bacterium]|nr:amidohydrolase family protein [Candidatus Dormibacteraeota bacterium]
MGETPGPLVITGANLIDGTGRDPISDAAVVVENGRFRTVGPASGVPRPRDAQVLHADGRTLLPGFIDAHVHAAYRARDLKQHLLNPPTYNILRSTSILRATLDCGVTTARDCGGADAGFRMALEENLVAGPRLTVSIAMISQTGGHGDTWVPASFRVPKRTWLPDSVADGVDEVRRVSRHLLMAGADFLKICATGGITSVTDSFDEPQYTVAELRACVEEGAARRRPVAAHAEGLEGIRNSLEAGVYSLEHGWFLDEECVELMLRNGTWWVPTLALVPRSVERRRADAAWSSQQVGAEDREDDAIRRRQLEQVPLWRHAVERGVRVAMGTDQSHRLLVGENLAELEYLVELLGMSPMEAIVASTMRGAECLGRPELGSIEAGKVADLVLVDGDPLADIRLLQDPARITVVMKDGAVHKNLVE